MNRKIIKIYFPSHVQTWEYDGDEARLISTEPL